MQAALATKSDKAAGRSIWIFAAVVLPGEASHLLRRWAGGSVRVLQGMIQERLDPLLPMERDVPAVSSLPSCSRAWSGPLISGVFAAAMGTLSGTDGRHGHAYCCRWISARSSRAARLGEQEQALRRVDDRHHRRPHRHRPLALLLSRCGIFTRCST